MVYQIFTDGIIRTNQTGINPAVGAATMATTNISENRFPFLKVTAMVKIVTTGTSTAQTLTFNVIDSVGPTTLQAFTYGATATAQNYLLHISAIYRKNTAGTITLQLGGGTADANTTITLQQWYIEGAEAEYQYLQL